MIAGYQEKVTVVRLTQTYNLLLNATKQMIQDEGLTIDQMGETDSERVTKYYELLPKYLKITDSCVANGANGVPETCLTGYKHFTYRLVNSSGVLGYKRHVLANGAIIGMYNTGGSCQQDMTLQKPGTGEAGSGSFLYGSYQHYCAMIFVDINGKKGPNVSDKDIFIFVLVQDGVVPSGSPKEVIWTEKFAEQCLGEHPAGSTSKCAAWVVYNKNMDYLHCPEKLGWNKASSCKD